MRASATSCSSPGKSVISIFGGSTFDAVTRSILVPVGVAVTSLSIVGSPAVAVAARPAKERDSGSVYAALLALPAAAAEQAPYYHSSHSSHASHASHLSHSSHFSSVGGGSGGGGGGYTVPSYVPPPAVTTAPAPLHQIPVSTAHPTHAPTSTPTTISIPPPTYDSSDPVPADTTPNTGTTSGGGSGGSAAEGFVIIGALGVGGYTYMRYRRSRSR